MGIFDRIFKPRSFKDDGYFKMLNGYAPVFHNWDGRLYESELVRASIDSISRHAGKLQIVINGSANPVLQTQLKKNPNEFQTWNQFLSRITTILYMTNTAFIIPVLGQYGQITGLYPIAPTTWELLEVNKEAWLRFTFSDGRATAFKLNEVGILVRHQYRSDLFGESNSALRDTMNLISIQRQAITESAKNSASFRFIAKVNNFARTEDLKKEQDRFNETTFQRDGGGLLLFPNTYSEIRELAQKSYSVDKDQMELIQTNVFNYFGTNMDVLQNKAFGDAWSAFYEGCIEPLAIQLSEVISRMIFTDRELGNGNEVMFTSNRLQYMTNSDKLNVSRDLLDRGVITINQALEIWNLPGIGEDGDVRIIRGEYYNADKKTKSIGEETENDE